MKRVAILALVSLALGALAQGPAQAPSEVEIGKGIGGLRSLADDARAAKTRELARAIRGLPAGQEKVGLAFSLENLATEGDFGPGTLQTVADTLVVALKETPRTRVEDYESLADLARYEGVKIDLDAPLYREALARVDALAGARAKVDFTLTDLSGKAWTRSALKGKVVLVNFWATWCPPCRKEMPDLSALQARFKGRLVVLGITDERKEAVESFLKAHPATYPVLLDPGRKVNDAYKVTGIPKNFVYGRDGKLVAQSIDMRTMRQFLKMLAKAGLQ